MFQKLIFAILLISNAANAWKYQTKCTHHVTSASNRQLVSTNQQEYNSIIDDFEHDLIIDSSSNDNLNLNQDKLMHLKCSNLNDFLFIGLTQYGVSSSKSSDCKLSQNDCLVSVDYIANQCNGLNSCDIQLDSQFLHSCKNHSDYLTISYECIPGSQRVDICSNEETFIIDSSQSNKKSNDLSLSRFNSFYLTSPNYPNEYSNNLDNCSCKLEYVRIDNTNIDYEQNEMNLVFKTYEFDLEEDGENEFKKCTKDSFKIDSEKSSQSLCGQYKDFKEFYSSGKKLSLNFNTDDVITRRGFLIKISSTQETTCPYGSSKFNSFKCIKSFGDNSETHKLNWFDSIKSCKSLNGRLITINDFIDESKLNSFIRTNSNDYEQYWALNKKNQTSKCTSKNFNTWNEDDCLKKKPYLCEFDPVPTNNNNQQKIKTSMSDNNGNRLIRVACGKSSTIFSADSSTTTKKLIKSNSITNTQKPTQKLISKLTSSSSKVTQKLNILDYDYESTILSSTTKISTSKLVTEKSRLIKEIETTYSSNTSNNNDNNKGLFNQDLVLIIAIACGVAIVLVSINLFCIWNYYNKKLNNIYNNSKKSVIDQTYRSSTLMRSTKTSSTSSANTNRTMTSTVDSYMKVPTYDLCLSTGINNLESNSACESSSVSTSGSELINYNLKANKNLINQQHIYETLNRQQLNTQWNNYAEYNPIHRLKQFDSIVVLPNSNNNQSHYLSSVPVNSTVVLLKQVQNEDQQYSCVVYGDLSSPVSTSSSSTSSTSTSSNQPLITFASNSNGACAI